MSKLLKTRRGHDSEDDYSDTDTDTDYSTEIDDESIHSISDVDQSDFDYEDDTNDLEDSDEDYDETDEEEEEEEGVEEKKENDSDDEKNEGEEELIAPTIQNESINDNQISSEQLTEGLWIGLFQKRKK